MSMYFANKSRPSSLSSPKYSSPSFDSGIRKNSDYQHNYLSDTKSDLEAISNMAETPTVYEAAQNNLANKEMNNDNETFSKKSSEMQNAIFASPVSNAKQAPIDKATPSQPDDSDKHSSTAQVPSGAF